LAVTTDVPVGSMLTPLPPLALIVLDSTRIVLSPPASGIGGSD
jgi:hypothetical protein